MIPSGWYYVADSREVAPGAVVRKELFGQALALWRTESGALHLSAATCPHMGSDLTQLGKVKGEHLQCFSHRHEYDGAGDCVKTPRALPCRTQRVLASFPIHETGGFVLAWYDASGRAPTWRIPDALFDTAGKGRWIKSQYAFDCNVTTINEDNFDVGHLYNWHELTSVKSSKPAVDGPTISVTHAFKRHSFLFKTELPLLSRPIESEYGSTLHGPGFTQSYIDLPAFDFHVDYFIWPTPITATRTQYTTFLRRTKRAKRKLVHALHPVLLPAFLIRLRGEHRHEGHGFWERQTRLDAPNVTAEERTMLEPYWDWCKQFAA